MFSYLLAVVVDDAAQGVTHVVRGADLLDNTPRQIYLQQELGLPTPIYAHVPVLVEADGSKLAKSARSVRLDPDQVLPQLMHVFVASRPRSAVGDRRRRDIAAAWAWARVRWDVKRSRAAKRCIWTLSAGRHPRKYQSRLALTLHCAIL